jgi:predicted MPP superfamily phosphohydrolase
MAPPILILGSLATAAVVTHAALRRGRLFATFAGVFTGVHTLAATALSGALAGALSPGVAAAYGVANAAVYAHFFALGAPAWRPSWYRALVSVPAHFLSATTLLALPFVGAHALGAPAAILGVPVAAGLIGLIDSLRGRSERYAIDLDGGDAGPLGRLPLPDAKEAPHALRVVQITDPHLGPFMSVARLREVARRAAEAEPDLVLLTGDFLTMESHHDPDLLAEALAPLAPLAGRTFACMGNHDHEAPATVQEGLSRAGVTLLVDGLARATTRLGEIEILGYDFRFRDRARHLAEVSARFPRSAGVKRLALLHDPGAFTHLPAGSADLVFSGHTHGGQLGLLWLGLPHTVVSLFTAIPDHGLWGRGADRLYVHRGTGQYGFPLRVGVPAEESVLLISGLQGEAA